MENLIIRLLPGGNLQWAVFTGYSGVIHEEAVTPSALLQIIPPPSGERKIILLVPGRDVLIKSITVPTKQRYQLPKVLAFLAEEHLAEDIHNLHIVAGDEDENSLTPILVVQKSLMSDWLYRLKTAGVEPDVMLPETLALPFDNLCWSVLCDETYTWLRTKPCQATSVENYMLTPLLELYCDADKLGPMALHLMYSDTKNASRIQSLGESLNGYYPQMQIQIAPEPITPFSAFCKGYLQQSPMSSLNLLRGDFADSTAKLKFKGAWRIIAACFAGWFILQVGGDLGESFYFSVKSNSMNMETVSLYKQLFPNDKTITNPLKQMKSHLSMHGHSSQNEFLRIMDHISRHWPSLEGNSTLQIHAIDFQDTPLRFALSVSANNINSINTLVQQLNADGIHATLVSVANEADGTKAKLSLEDMNHE